MVVNHCKSKGDSTPRPTGDTDDGIQGAFHGARVREAQDVTDFAEQVAAEPGYADRLPGG